MFYFLFSTYVFKKLFMQFPSMAPLQNALPSGQPAPNLIHNPGYGNPTSTWMPHQPPSNIPQLPPQGPYQPTLPSSKMIPFF